MILFGMGAGAPGEGSGGGGAAGGAPTQKERGEVGQKKKKKRRRIKKLCPVAQSCGTGGARGKALERVALTPRSGSANFYILDINKQIIPPQPGFS